MNKDIIYINGDSFTQGCEMGHHIAPIFTGYYSLKEIQDLHDKNPDDALKKQAQYSKMYHNFFNSDKNLNVTKKIIQYERENRWSSTLEKILDRPVLNISSQGGSSMEAIAYRTLLDLYVLTSQGYNVTDIIIQLTGPYRYTFFKDTSDDGYRNDYYKGPYNIISANINHPDDNLREFAKKLSLTEKDHSVVRTLFNIYELVHSIKSNYKSRLIIVDSLFYKPSPFIFNPFDITNAVFSNHFLLNFKKKLDEEVELSMMELVKPEELDTMTLGYHFTTKIHNVFAEKIANRYFK